MTRRQRSKLQTEKICYITGRSDNLELHHCLNGNAYRKKCDADGLTVWLTASVHWYIHNTIEGKELRIWLKQEAQRKYEEEHTREEFIKRYGKNYL